MASAPSIPESENMIPNQKLRIFGLSAFKRRLAVSSSDSGLRLFGGAAWQMTPTASGNKPILIACNLRFTTPWSAELSYSKLCFSARAKVVPLCQKHN